MKPAIRVENLSKQYTIGRSRRGEYRTLRESFTDALKWPLRALRKKLDRRAEPFWALRDVAFEVEPGEVVGIIGRNGAGKSTLLKILSRITEPTSGRIEVRGRMGSLLEVGTGFHPELTGRENIFLNGSILGMTRREIVRKFDEIVAFSEIEQFLDTPVKRYSSGMYVRLAFAIASHLEPEILVVDEVLAVGDVGFQEKCLGKMNEVRRHGRTVLFVSHNFGAVDALCTRAILIENGQVAGTGPVRDMIRTYLQRMEVRGKADLSERRDRNGTGRVRLLGVELRDELAMPTGHLPIGHQATFEFRASKYLPGMYCTFTLYDQLGSTIASFQSGRAGRHDRKDFSLSTQFVCTCPEVLIHPGRYRVNVALHHGSELVDHVEGAFFFDVTPGNVRGRVVDASTIGVVHVPHEWRTPQGDGSVDI